MYADDNKFTSNFRWYPKTSNDYFYVFVLLLPLYIFFKNFKTFND